MKYKVTRNIKYDFAGQSYGSVYPNLHKYPAAMLPQIGIELFKELNIKKGTLLDPYCGSGSSFAVGIDRGLNEMYGFDINPLAVLISQAKFTKINLDNALIIRQELRDSVFEFIKKEKNIEKIDLPLFKNVGFWYSKEVLQHLTVLKLFIQQIKNEKIKRLFLVPFSETARECSYTRNSEFKLYRIKEEDILNFNPDVLGVYFQKLNKVLDKYTHFYYPKIKNTVVDISFNVFPKRENFYDIVLTSPPYGDSKTTVAYGQFSHFANEWIGIDYARQVDSMLMGGKNVKENYKNGVIGESVELISKENDKRAKEVSSFYFDLEKSILDVAKSVKKGGKIIYVVGNRTVKGVKLPTDQFIAEKFSENRFEHLKTYERIIGNKVMPSKNSPSNIKGAIQGTMTKEYIVICEKK
jgi:hypothetical protein